MKTKSNAAHARAGEDSARRVFSDALINFSTGVTVLPQREQLAIIRRVRKLDNFADGNDFGAFAHNGRTIRWRLDYLDAVLRIPRDAARERPPSPRVVCVSLAEER
jgi:hypothetical protein